MIYCNLFHLNRLSDTNAKSRKSEWKTHTESQLNHREKERDKSKKAWNLQYILQLAVRARTAAQHSGTGEYYNSAHCAYLNVAWEKKRQNGRLRRCWRVDDLSPGRVYLMGLSCTTFYLHWGLQGMLLCSNFLGLHSLAVQLLSLVLTSF